jgi:AcrR family transcriptional regulator
MDAARNRAAVLDAAARLFAEHGVGAVSMDAIAAAAGVGKGTLFRRFGDKSGLAVALLDERERELQKQMISGPAPLGPGEPGPAQLGAAQLGAAQLGAAEAGRAQLGDAGGAAPRLHAFVDAYLDYLLAHLDLVRMSETAAPGARYRIGAYRFWHRHVAFLLGGRCPDPEYAAHALLAGLGAEHVGALLPELGAERLRAGLHHTVDALTGRTDP